MSQPLRATSITFVRVICLVVCCVLPAASSFWGSSAGPDGNLARSTLAVTTKASPNLPGLDVARKTQPLDSNASAYSSSKLKNSFRSSAPTFDVAFDSAWMLTSFLNPRRMNHVNGFEEMAAHSNQSLSPFLVSANLAGTGSITANPNPIQVCDSSGLGITTLTWSSSGTITVEVHVGSPSGALIASGVSGKVTTSKSVSDGTIFYLQDVSGKSPLTLATVTVGVTTAGCATPTPTPTPAAPIYEGWHDGADCSTIFGWAADRNRLNTSISVDIYDGVTFLATVLANQSRPDVCAYLGDNGLHGYSYPVPASLKNGQPHSITVKFAGTGTSLAGTPRSITCSTCSVPVAPPPASLPPDNVWVEDQTPSGAVLAGTWVWDTSQKASGSQSNTEPAVAGIHQHFFYGAPQPLTINPGDKLVSYVLLNPCNPPQEIMLQWNDSAGSWEHRAFWGADLIPWGAPGTTSRFPMGALPQTGVWVRLEVPASAVGLEGITINGLAFTLYEGQAWFDRAGKLSRLRPISTTASNSYPGAPPSLAVDGSLSTMWNSGGYAPQWIQLDLGQLATVSQIRLNVAQLPDGQTTHEIYGETDPQALTLIRTPSGFTQSGQWLEPTFAPAINNTRYLKILTTASPSWVAWNEIEVYGSFNASTGSRSPHNATQTPWSVPSNNNIEVEDFDDWNPPKGEGHTYHDDTVGNEWGLYRPGEDVEIGNSSDVGGGYIVGNAHGGEWLEYTINVTSNPFDVQVRVASGGTGGRFHVAFDGLDRTGPIQVPDTGSWGTWATLTFPNISLPLGQHIMRLALDQNGTQPYPAVADFNYIRLVAPPSNGATFISQSVPTSMVAGQSYNVSVTMKNTGTNTWTSANLYRLGSQNPQDNGTWGTSRVALPASVAPGSQVTFNFTVTAPAAPNTYNFQWCMVQDGVMWFGDFTTNVQVTVSSSNLGSRAPHNATQTPWSVPSNNNIEVEDFDDWNPPKGEGHTYHDDTVGNEWGLYRPGEDVEIGNSSDVGGGYIVGNAHGGEWLEYTINVTSNPFDIQVRVASGGTGGRFHVAFDGLDRTGPIQVPDTGSWGTWATLTFPNISLPLGQHIMRLALHQNGTQPYPAVADFNYIRLVAPGVNQPPTVSITAPVSGTTFTAPATISI